jgi:hypothetical protein
VGGEKSNNGTQKKKRKRNGEKESEEIKGRSLKFLAWKMKKRIK